MMTHEEEMKRAFFGRGAEHDVNPSLPKAKTQVPVSSESKFTPGPWRIGNPGEKGGIGVDATDHADGLNFEVCEVWGVDVDSQHDERSQANAKLIVAAPDLLDALQSLVRHAEALGRHCELYDKARAAIAKATA